MSALVLSVHAGDFIHNGPGDQQHNIGVDCSYGKTEYLNAQKASFYTYVGIVVSLFAIMAVGGFLVPCVFRKKKEISPV